MSNRNLKLVTKEEETIDIGRNHNFTSMCELIKTVCDDGRST